MNARKLASAALVILILAVSARGIRSVERDLRAGRASSLRIRSVGNIPDIRGFAPGTAEAIVTARRVIPSDVPIRIVTRGGSCGVIPLVLGGAELEWLAYHLLPRTLTCDPDTSWQVYVGVEPTDLPPGAQVSNVGATITVVQQ